MLKSKEILYSKGKNDECYTPAYAVTPILKYIPEYAVVWCPFDKEESLFVKQICQRGNKVIATHIDNGQDFYKYEPQEHWDLIISNPPYTGKKKIFIRALSFNKPFALLMTNVWLNDAAPKQLFKDKDLQLLMFEQRINYINGDGTKFESQRPTFSSSYFCYNFLPKQIIMARFEENKANL